MHLLLWLQHSEAPQKSEKSQIVSIASRVVLCYHRSMTADMVLQHNHGPPKNVLCTVQGTLQEQSYT